MGALSSRGVPLQVLVVVLIEFVCGALCAWGCSRQVLRDGQAGFGFARARNIS